MDFYKLTNFQLYSILNSRHLDKTSKEAAQREFDRRSLSEEQIQQLADELTEKTKGGQSIFNINPNIAYLVAAAVFAIFLLRQCVHQ